jgi:hypothetical protein
MRVKGTKSSRSEQPLLLPIETQHEQAIRQDETVRATGRDKEAAFRRALGDFLHDYQASLPRPLYEAILDHLTRTDHMGLSLCFNGPLRQVLLAEVSRWLTEANQVAAGTRWQALAASQTEEDTHNAQT